MAEGQRVDLRFVRSHRYRPAMTIEDDRELTRALSEARERRRTLHQTLVELEQAISSPGSGRIPSWTGAVRTQMDAVCVAFEQHVEVTEKPDGLYDEIEQRAPRLAGNVERLRDEHPAIGERITELTKRLGHAEIGGTEWPLDEARDDLQRFIGVLIRHRQKGADLVWEAYNVDIGGPE